MATGEESNGICSELVETKIKFTVNNISKLKNKIYGPSVKVRGMTFRPMIKPCENVEGRFTSLGFFLVCEYVGAEAKDSKCKVNVQYKLIAQDGKTEDLVRESPCEFSTLNTGWGYNDFIEWYELIKPAWRKNDSILLKIAFEIEEVSNLSAGSDTEMTTVTTRNTEKDSKDSEKGVPVRKRNKRRRRNRPVFCAGILKEIHKSQKKLIEKIELVQQQIEEPNTEIKNINLKLEKIEIKYKLDSEKKGDGRLVETEKPADVENDIKTETLESGDSNTTGSYDKIEISEKKNSDDNQHAMPEQTDDFQSAQFNLQDDDDSGSEYSLLNE